MEKPFDICSLEKYGLRVIAEERKNIDHVVVRCSNGNMLDFSASQNLSERLADMGIRYKQDNAKDNEIKDYYLEYACRGSTYLIEEEFDTMQKINDKIEKTILEN